MLLQRKAADAKRVADAERAASNAAAAERAAAAAKNGADAKRAADAAVAVKKDADAAAAAMKDLENAFMTVWGRREGDEEGGRTKAEMRRAWAVSQATSISGVYSISVQRTYMGESLPESSHGLGEPGQDLRIVRDRGPNDALNDIVLTSGYDGDLDNALMEVWGRRGRWRGR